MLHLCVPAFHTCDTLVAVLMVCASGLLELDLDLDSTAVSVLAALARSVAIAIVRSWMHSNSF